MDDTLVWLGKKNKHIQTGYPLVASLMSICVQQADYDTSRFYGLIEKLHKLMRDSIFSDAVRDHRARYMPLASDLECAIQ